MIETMHDLPGQLVGVRVTAPVTADDYEQVLIPAIEAAVREHGPIRLLYVLDCRVSEFSLGALWDDAKLGFSHLQDFRRIAIVTGDHFVRATLSAFQFAMPNSIKVFDPGTEDTAIEWLAES